MCFGYHIISPWKRVSSFIWMKLNPIYLRMLCAEIGSVALEKKIFKFRKCFFHYFIIISPWKRAGPLIWTNLNQFYPRMLCAKFGWNWPSGGEKKMNMWKVYRQTDDRWSEKLTWAFSSGELKQHINSQKRM